ncbi:MAG TPA: DUF4054 domain-containing protein [Candidatus Binatia bacterium]|nr:DUF4054 domain-containing protein [Candidatus Binatia bacterium]
MSNPIVPGLPSTFTFFALAGQYLNWYLFDSISNQPINNSAITATLYKDRSLTDPTGTPGTPVTFFTGVTIAYVPNTNGQYRVVIPAAFNPPLGNDYVLVVDAVTPGYANQHWEIAASVTSAAPRITNPILTPAQLRTDFPEFEKSATYPDSTINFWICVASKLLNPCRWDDMLKTAMELFVAHNLVLEVQAQQTALNDGWPGISKGAINNESAGAVSVGYDTASVLEADAGHWNLTVYGTRFIRLARMFGSGPIQVGPTIPFAAIFTFAGGGLGAFFGPGGWVGPWPLPGMWNFG